MSNIIDAYDAIACDYKDYSFGRHQYLSAVETIVLGELAEASSIVDIGTGDGRRFLKILNSLGNIRHLAVEPSANMVEQCKKRELNVIQASFNNLQCKINDKFTAALALWNVLGHVENHEMRINALQQVYDILEPGGVFICDINNRHNMPAYGYSKVITRIFQDWLFFSEHRGDASYTWEINGKSFQAHGHLFTPTEAESLFENIGFTVEKRWAVNYDNGRISKNKYLGQLLYVLRKM